MSIDYSRPMLATGWGAFIELSVVNLVGAGHAWTAVYLFFTQRSSPSWAGALRINRSGCDASAEGV